MENTILITCMGGGMRYRDKETREKQSRQDLLLQERQPSKYEQTNYRFEDNDKIIETPFVMEVLMKKEEPKKLLILGTVGSNWFELYWHFYQKMQQKIKEKPASDDSVLFDTEEQFFGYLEFLDSIKKDHNYQTDAEQLNELEQKLQTVEKLLGSFFDAEVKIILLRYGINREENLKNFERFYALEAWMNPQKVNKVSMDITHSFRSLAFYQFMFIHYLIQTSRYKVVLKNVYYGMFEVINELGYAPVVDLSILTDMMEWINGIFEVNQYGGTGKVSKLLEHHYDGSEKRSESSKSNEKDLRDWLEIFEYATATNDFKKMSYTLKKIIEMDINSLKGLKPYEHRFIKRLQEDLLKRFQDVDDDLKEAKLQLQMARWFLDQNRLGSGVVLLQETVLTFLASLLRRKPKYLDKRIDDKSFRNQAWYELKKIAEIERGGKYQSIHEDFHKGKHLRDLFAHNLFDVESLSENLEEKSVLKNIEEECEFLDEYYQELKRIIDSSAWHDDFIRTASTAGEKSTNELSKTIKWILVLGKKERQQNIWKSVDGQYSHAKKMYLEEKLEKQYSNPLLTTKELKKFKKDLLVYLEDVLREKGIQQNQLLVAMQSTDYYNQTEILKKLQESGYHVAALKKSIEGNFSLKLL